MVATDTNILLRAALDDHPVLSPQAREILKNNEIFVLTQVVAEFIYVSESVYHHTREQIAEALFTLTSSSNVRFEYEDILPLAIETYRDTNLDFVDALLYAYHRVTKVPIKTFDKGLLRTLAQTEEEAAPRLPPGAAGPAPPSKP